MLRRTRRIWLARRSVGVGEVEVEVEGSGDFEDGAFDREGGRSS